MKLVKLLSSVITESVDPNLVLEISDKVKNQLITKFKGQTSDDEKTIADNIQYFDRIKDSLPADKRDITRYDYTQLSSLIQGRKKIKAIDDIFKLFKKKEKGIENKALKDNIKKFLDIQEDLPKNRRDLKKYTFLDLVKLNKDYWEKLIGKKSFTKFKKEREDLNNDALIYYIDAYVENYETLPENTPSILDMSFEDLEHLIDGIQSKEQGLSGKKDYSGVEVIYDKDNLLIFQPKTKDQCIKLRNGRGWCTSREGGSNLYYNYRLENNLTLYYVIDEDKPFSDLNHASVILVDSRGGKRLADGSNSGRYAGGTVIPWSEISSKIEKLSDKENLFVPKPLSNEEQDLLRKYRNLRVGDDPIKELGGEYEAEMWLEMSSPRLGDTQYSNLTKELKKKYIALGMDLTSNQIQNSEPEVMKYYLSKKIEGIKNKKIDSLTAEDITLLNLPMMKKVKEDLKPKFIMDAVSAQGKRAKVSYPIDNGAKFIALYGFDEFFDSLPSDIENLIIENESKEPLALEIPSTISRFKNLNGLSLVNVVKSLPEEIGALKNLVFLHLKNNPSLTRLPQSIMDLPELSFVALQNTNAELPEGFTQKFGTDGNGMWDVFSL